MQAIRHLARRFGNHRLIRRIYRPAFVQQGEGEAHDVPDEFRKRKIESEDETFRTRLEIEAAFYAQDRDGDGRLNMDEASEALRKHLLPTSRSTLNRVVQASPYQLHFGDECIMDLEGFASLIRKRKESLHDAYHWMTKQKSKGFYPARAWRIVAEKAGVYLSDNEIRIIQERASKHMKYSEFIQCLMLAPEVNPRYFLDSWYTEAFCDDAESQFSSARDIGVGDESSFAQAAAKKLTCGGLAGAMARTLTAPLDRVRVVLMTSTERLALSMAWNLAISNGGYTGLWMGNGVNCLKISPEVGIKLLTFDMWKNQIAQDPSNVTVSERFVAGGLAGIVSQVSVYPLETVKTRLSMRTSGPPIGMNQCIRTIAQTDGFGALYAGVGPSIIGVIPYSAIDLTLNSWLKDKAADYMQHAKQETSVPVLLGCGMISSGTAAIITFPLNVIRTRAQATGESFNVVLQWLYAAGG